MNTLRDIDLAWVAVDVAGRLAVFTTAGEGPVPESALKVSASAHAAVAQLPVVGGSDLLVKYKRPDDFIAFAERGLYAYDWRDVHRTRGDCTNSYELIAKPLHPVSIGDIPPGLRAPFEATVIFGAHFGQPGVAADRVATKHPSGEDA